MTARYYGRDRKREREKERPTYHAGVRVTACDISQVNNKRTRLWQRRRAICIAVTAIYAANAVAAAPFMSNMYLSPFRLIEFFLALICENSSRDLENKIIKKM